MSKKDSSSCSYDDEQRGNMPIDARQEHWNRIVKIIRDRVLPYYRSSFEKVGGDVEDAFQNILKRRVAKVTAGQIEWSDPTVRWKDDEHMIRSFNRALKNELKNQVKRYKRSPDGEMESAELLVEDTHVARPDVMLDRRERNDIVREALSRLAPETQQLVRAVMDTDTIGEAAALLGISEDVAYKRWERVLELFIQMRPEVLMSRWRSRSVKKEEN